MVGGQRGGVVFDVEPGRPSEGMGYTHEDVQRNIKKKYGTRRSETEQPITEEPEPETPVGPLTPEGTFYSGKNYTPHGVDMYYTKSAYEQYWLKQYHRGLETYQSIDPQSFYMVDGKEIYGHSLRQQIKTGWLDPSYKNYWGARKLGEGFSIYRTDTGFEFQRVEPGPSVGGFGSFLLGVGDWAYESLKGEPNVWTQKGKTVYFGETSGNPFETSKMKEVRLGNYYRDVEAWKRGDIGHFGIKIISNPYTLGLISMGMGSFSSGLQYSKWGSTGFWGSSYVTRGTAVKSFIGGASTGYITGTGTKIHREQGDVGLREYAGKLVFFTPIAIGGYEIGQHYGYNLSARIRHFGSGLSERISNMPGVKQFSYHVQSFKETGLIAKNLGRYNWHWADSKYLTEHNLDASRGGILVGKSFNREMITTWEQIQGKRPDPFRNYMATERLGGYESSWEMYRSTLNEPRTIYPIKKIFYQPSRTFLIPTKSGTKFISIGFNEQYISYGNITPLDSGFKMPSFGTGKKGGELFSVGKASGDTSRMFVTGEEVYLHYPPKGSATIFGPKGDATVRLFASPILRERSFYGMVSSQDIPTYGTSDYSAMFSSGSYRSYIPGSIKFSREMPFSFGGRVFNESFFTESISFVKQVGGGSQLIRTRIGSGNIYGSRTIELPRIDYARSFSSIQGGDPFKVHSDTSFTLYPEPPKPKLDFGGGGIGYESKPESVIGSNPFADLKSVVQMPKYPSGMLGGFRRVSLRTGLGQIESYESGIYGSSGYWNDMFRGMRPALPSVNVFTPGISGSEIGSITSIGAVSGSMSLSKSLNVNINIPKSISLTDISRLSGIKTIPNVITESRTDISQQQKQQLKQISSMKLSLVTVTMPFAISTPKIISVSEPVSRPPPVFDMRDFDMHGYTRNIRFPILDGDSFLKRGKKKQQEFDIFGKGYRYRRLLAPSLKDLI